MNTLHGRHCYAPDGTLVCGWPDCHTPRAARESVRIAGLLARLDTLRQNAGSTLRATDTGQPWAARGGMVR